MKGSSRNRSIVAACLALVAACVVAAPASALDGVAAAGAGEEPTLEELPSTESIPDVAGPDEPGSTEVGETAAATGDTGTQPAIAPTGGATDDVDDPMAVQPGPTGGTPFVPAGTVRELRAQEARLLARHAAIQAELIELEGRRQAAEERLDAVLVAYTEQLLVAWESADPERTRLLAALRDADDADTRAALVAQLHQQDRALGERYAAATAAVDAAAIAADRVRGRLLTVGSALSAVRHALAANETGQPDADGGRSGGSIRADHVFATGPIPGIGYWGADGADLAGSFTSMAGLAMGGVGCEPPRPGMRPTGTVEAGDASWYGPGFHGQGTANGEVYDQEAMTAAHPTLPFDSVVKVVSSTTGRCAFVRINDRGPFVAGRVIDLSHAAAEAIGLSGVAPVQLEVWAGAAAPVSNATP